MATAGRAARESQTAARVAASRRPAGRSRGERAAARPAKGSGRSAGRGHAKKQQRPPSKILRALKLSILIAAFASIGFFGVLVVDVGLSLVGKVRLGEITLVEIWDKVVDRMLDRDVPRTVAPDKVAPAPSSRGRDRGPTLAERAPTKAMRPEEDARHVTGSADPQDPQVERARKRLDELLGRL